MYYQCVVLRLPEEDSDYYLFQMIVTAHKKNAFRNRDHWYQVQSIGCGTFDY